MMRVEIAKLGLPSLFLFQILSLFQIAAGEERDFFGTPASGMRLMVAIENRNCGNCHRKASAASDTELPPELRGPGNDGWILGDELNTWFSKDLHFQAYAVLRNKLSEQIGSRLGIVAHQDRRCLACHTSVPFQQMETIEANSHQVKVDTTRDSRFAVGISCEGCHGPAGTPSGKNWNSWEQAHTQSSTWRKMPPEVRFEEYGYWNVHSTRTQTRICLSCHLGNVEQKKIITHEMYAAGHPPLPSFELSQFIHQMPRHWRRIDEKPEELRNDFFKDNPQFTDSKTAEERAKSLAFAQTKLTMVSSLVALEESLRLSADLIDQPSASAQWPELANYSCFACHHELSRDGWRKKQRLLTTVAGRPTLHEWPFALSGLMGPAVDKDLVDFRSHDKIKSVAQALGAQPYGKPADLKTALRELAKTLELESRKLSQRAFDRDFVKRYLEHLVSVAATETFDYDSARQFIWAYERMLADLSRSSKSTATSDLCLLQNNTNPGKGQDQIFAGFEKSLTLCLTAPGREAETVTLYPSGNESKRRLRSVNLTEPFNRISQYDPAAVQMLFKQLQEQHRELVDNSTKE